MLQVVEMCEFDGFGCYGTVERGEEFVECGDSLSWACVWGVLYVFRRGLWSILERDLNESEICIYGF